MDNYQITSYSGAEMEALFGKIDDLGNASQSTAGLMSAADKTKLDGLDSGAQANVLEGVKIAGADLPITEKKVNIPADSSPTSGSNSLVRSGGVFNAIKDFITRSVNDLVNYYTKSDTYTKTEVNNIIGSLQQFHYEIYASTSAVTNPQSNVLYLIGPTGTGSDKYEEYVYSNGWVKIGDTTIDLSGYSTTEQMNAAINNALQDYATKEEVSQLGQEVTELQKKTSDFSAVMNNYLDKDNVHKEGDSYGYWNPGNYGAFTPDNAYRCTENYVPIEAGHTYYVFQKSGTTISAPVVVSVCWYDADRRFISGQAYRNNYTAPNNAVYARFNFLYYENIWYMVLGENSAPDDYIPFGYVTTIGDSVVYPKFNAEISSILQDLFRINPNIKSVIFGKGAAINAVINAGGNWYITSDAKCLIVPVNAGDILTIKNAAEYTYIAFLKSIEIPVNGTPVDYATGSSWTPIAYSRTFTAPSDAKYLYITLYVDSVNRVPEYANINGYDILNGIDGNLHNIIDEVNLLKEKDFASGDAKTPILVDNRNDMYLIPKTATEKQKEINLDRILAINHDDFNVSDLIGTRLIYAKYGFNGTFNFILKPFASISGRDNIVLNAKKLLRDGNGIGLHAWFARSCWFANKMIDIRPDSTFSFAPTLSEVQGSNPDGTGVNSFGKTVTADTTFNDIGFIGVYSKVASCTESEYVDVIKKYCVYFILNEVSGVDLDGNVVTKNILEWTEYWFNKLIDGSLGYSTYTGTIAERFAADYTGTYPSAENIKSGNLSGAGHFTRGLFKDCATCCNMEVADRIIKVAEAFCRYYFGIEHFSSFGRHGEVYMQTEWKDANGVSYDDRDKTILTNECGKVYRSLFGGFFSQFDILKRNFIKITNQQSPTDKYANYICQQGLYYGQNEIRGNLFNSCIYPYGRCTFLSVFRKGVSNYFVSFASVSNFVNAHKEQLKYAYEHAGEVYGTDTDNIQYQITSDIRECINVIIASLGTGKIPALSLDTVADSPNTALAVSLFCDFCFANDIQIVPMEKAREIATTRVRKMNGNLFPNPIFRQTLLEYFGGSSTYCGSYIPDGWTRPYITADDGGYDVNTIVVDGKNVKELAFTGGSQSRWLVTSIFGLTAGRYKFSAYVKSTNSNNAMITVGKVLNKSTIDGAGQVFDAQSASPNSEYQLVDFYIDIEQPDFIAEPESITDKFGLGYSGENVAAIKVQLTADDGKVTSIHSPKLVMVQ